MTSGTSFPVEDPKNINMTKTKARAVGLFSGGLDSCLATKIVCDQGVDVTGVFCRMPWGGGEEQVERLAKQIGIALHIISFGEDYLEILKSPRHGYGSSFNPCMDCHIFMIKKAAEYSATIAADFVFTGEVVGQRPMSQRKDCLAVVEEETGLVGRLLRPLSAKLLPPTIPETSGLIDRGKLFDISGRSRKIQFALAQEWGLEGFSQPAGGCLLADAKFGRRMKDFLMRGYPPGRNLAVLRWGRYFRLDDNCFALISRDQREGDQLKINAAPDDIIFEMREVPGPTGLLRTDIVRPEILGIVSGLVQYFSKSKNTEPRHVFYWPARNDADIKTVPAAQLSDDEIEKMIP